MTESEIFEVIGRVVMFLIPLVVMTVLMMRTWERKEGEMPCEPQARRKIKEAAYNRSIR